MKIDLEILRSSRLFSGVSDDSLTAVLDCLTPREECFPKDAFLLRAGDSTESIGFVLSGSALIIQEDVWGNRNIISRVGPGQTFAAAFACAPGSVLNVSVIAETPVAAMFLNVNRILHVRPSACSHHIQIIQNLLGELSENNLHLGQKLIHMGQRTTRAKLMSFFSAEAQRLGTYAFDISFTRQQLADYLAVERSGLSTELGKMRREGLLDFHRNHFILNAEKGKRAETPEAEIE